MGWQRFLSAVALGCLAVVLSSCGSNSSTTSTPTVTVICTPSSVTVLGTSQCTATVTNESSTLVNWSVSGTGNGSITAGGLYTAPASVPTTNNGVVTVTATSQVSGSLTGTQGVTIQAATAIATVVCLDPTSSSNTTATTVTSGSSLDCTATAVTGATVPVTWTVTNTSSLGGNVGTISPQGGNYVAPLVPPPGQNITITASTPNNLSVMHVTVNVIYGNKVLNGSYVFSTSGRLTNGSNSFWARVGSFAAGGGTLSGSEDTNQGGSPNTVTTQRAFTGSYSIGADGRGVMQFCENASQSCPLGSTAVTAYFRIAVVSPTEVKIIEYSSPASASAPITGGGEILAQDPLIQPNSANLSGVYSFNFYGISNGAAEQSVIGDFSSNGFGTINAGSTNGTAAGEVDINASGPSALAGTTYLINSNGRGTVALNGLNFSFYPVSASRVKFIEVDPVPPSATNSSILLGDAFKQQTSLNCGWGLNALSGLTVLQTTGASSAVAVSDLGSFSVSGTGGSFTGASLDENNGGTVASQIGTLAGTYTMDACGRGTLAVGTHSYVYYIISPSNAVLQETTSGVVAHGFLIPAQGGPFTDATLTGSYAFRVGGTDAAGSAGKREDFVGQLTSAGTGTGLTGSVDLNDFGATQTGVAVSAGTFLPVPAASIRGTVSLPVALTPAATKGFVLYMVSPNTFYLLGTDATGTALGVMNLQF